MAGRERRKKAHRQYYRETAEGRKQHQDEERARRKRRRNEAADAVGGDRRCKGEDNQVGMLAAVAEDEAAKESPPEEPRKNAPIEWTLVVSPELWVEAQHWLGTQWACPICGSAGEIRHLVALAEWRRARWPKCGSL